MEDEAFGGSCGELWECESALSGRLLDLPRGGTNTYHGIGWVDVIAQGGETFSKVDPAGYAINRDSVKNRKWGLLGRL